jgi:hypothetical protein
MRVREGRESLRGGGDHLGGRAQHAPPKRRTVDRRRCPHASYTSAVLANVLVGWSRTGRRSQPGASGRWQVAREEAASTAFARHGRHLTTRSTTTSRYDYPSQLCSANFS